MKKPILRFGLFGAITICILFLLSWYLGKDLTLTTQEIIGYATMVVSLSFIYFGIKHFRDQVNNGTVTLKQGLLIGASISLLTALAFGVLDVIYIEYINPNFMTEYYNETVAKMKASLPKDQFQAKLAEMESQKALFSNPIFNFSIMSMTVFLIGCIISLISALILKRKN